MQYDVHNAALLRTTEGSGLMRNPTPSHEVTETAVQQQKVIAILWCKGIYIPIMIDASQPNMINRVKTFVIYFC